MQNHVTASKNFNVRTLAPTANGTDSLRGQVSWSSVCVCVDKDKLKDISIHYPLQINHWIHPQIKFMLFYCQYLSPILAPAPIPRHQHHIAVIYARRLIYAYVREGKKAIPRTCRKLAIKKCRVIDTTPCLPQLIT